MTDKKESNKDNQNKNQNDQIKHNSAVPPRGSKKIHSEKDDSTKDGFKPNKK